MASTQRKNLPAGAKKSVSKTKKVVIISVTAGLVALAMLAASLLLILNWDEYYYIPADRKTVATCNGYKIPYEELRHITMRCKSDMAYEYGDHIWANPETAESYREELESRVKESLQENYVLLSMSKSLNTEYSVLEQTAYVDAQISRLKSDLEAGGKYTYEEYLAECYMTKHFCRTYFKLEYLSNWISSTPGLMLDVADSPYQHKNVSAFENYVLTSGDYVRVIYVETSTLEKAQTITDTMQAISDSAARKSAFVTELTKDPWNSGEDGIYFTLGEMWEACEVAAFALDEYEVSDPVEIDGDYFVYMRLPMDEDYVKKNAHILLNSFHTVVLNKACIVEFNEYGESIDLVAMQ